jgi:hypothetical protein
MLFVLSCSRSNISPQSIVCCMETAVTCALDRGQQQLSTDYMPLGSSAWVLALAECMLGLGSTAEQMMCCVALQLTNAMAHVTPRV